MKEASGELSMTAITVVAIAAIGVVFTTLIWPSIKSNIERNTHCSQTISCTNCNGTTCDCIYVDEDGANQTETCPDKE
ncbi:MAG: hypothetical protein PHX04_02565 [Bacilli bacterium]|nr:hypothetical protein [Bacilli bacterium]